MHTISPRRRVTRARSRRVTAAIMILLVVAGLLWLLISAEAPEAREDRAASIVLPEPSSLDALGAGLVSLIWLRRRSRAP